MSFCSQRAPGNIQEPLFLLPHCDGISVWPGAFFSACWSSISLSVLHPAHIHIAAKKGEKQEELRELQIRGKKESNKTKLSKRSRVVSTQIK